MSPRPPSTAPEPLPFWQRPTPPRFMLVSDLVRNLLGLSCTLRRCARHGSISFCPFPSPTHGVAPTTLLRAPRITQWWDKALTTALFGLCTECKCASKAPCLWPTRTRPAPFTPPHHPTQVQNEDPRHTHLLAFNAVWQLAAATPAPPPTPTTPPTAALKSISTVAGAGAGAGAPTPPGARDTGDPAHPHPHPHPHGDCLLVYSTGRSPHLYRRLWVRAR